MGIKAIEARSWTHPTRYVGPVLIHAARTGYDLDGAQWLINQGHTIPPGLCRGAIVGRVELAACVTEDVARSVLSRQRWLWLRPDAMHLVFTDPEMAQRAFPAYSAGPNLVQAPPGWKDAFAVRTSA